MESYIALHGTICLLVIVLKERKKAIREMSRHPEDSRFVLRKYVREMEVFVIVMMGCWLEKERGTSGSSK
jgi:hypothetical protein